MSISFHSNSNFVERSVNTPCLCSQFAPSWKFPMTEEELKIAKEDLRSHANPSCSSCNGTGIEVVQELVGSSLNWSNDNAMAVMGALGFEWEQGKASVPELLGYQSRALKRD